jgi:hypothetical protein
MRYDQRDVEGPVLKIWQQLYQRSTFQVTANRQQWCLNQAEAGDPGAAFSRLGIVNRRENSEFISSAFIIPKRTSRLRT